MLGEARMLHFPVESCRVLVTAYGITMGGQVRLETTLRTGTAAAALLHRVI